MNKYDEVKLAEIKYGLETLYLTVSKLIIIFIFSYLLNILDYTILFLLFYFPIRTLSFGFHANSSMQCLIVSCLVFLLIPLLANNFTLHVMTKTLIYFCLAIGYWIMAPKDTKKKPMRNNKKRFWLKIFSVCLVIIYFLISLIVKNNLIINLMLLALIVQLILISPIPFLMSGQKYNFKWFK